MTSFGLSECVKNDTQDTNKEYLLLEAVSDLCHERPLIEHQDVPIPSVNVIQRLNSRVMWHSPRKCS